MINYEDIKNANDEIRPIDIKGKDYIEVNQRIKAFRMVFPNGSITTDIIYHEDGMVIFKATVKDGENVLGTGTAYEKENSTFINKTSYIENCETSAVGRALGMCGFGIDTSIASAEEVQNAMANQDKEPKTPLTPGQLEFITQHNNLILNELKEKKIKSANQLKKLSIEEATDLIKIIEERIQNG